MQVDRSHGVEDNASYDLGQGQIKYFLKMHFPLNRSTSQLQTLQVHRSYDVENTGQRFVFVLDIKGEKMYFFVNASPPKPLEIAISNFAGAFVR